MTATVIDPNSLYIITCLVRHLVLTLLASLCVELFKLYWFYLTVLSICQHFFGTLVHDLGVKEWTQSVIMMSRLEAVFTVCYIYIQMGVTVCRQDRMLIECNIHHEGPSPNLTSMGAQREFHTPCDTHRLELWSSLSGLTIFGNLWILFKHLEAHCYFLSSYFEEKTCT